MKVVLACRNAPGGLFVASRLNEQGLLQGVLVESGAPARKRKLQRLFTRNPIIKWPVIIANLTALTIYTCFMSRRLHAWMTNCFGITDFPQTLPSIHVDDINQAESLSFLKEQQPDILVVHGTAILKQPLLEVATRYTLNIHGGIVPWYRNVHSDLWAFLQRDFEKIGISIIHLDAGIDTGDIAVQKKAPADTKDSLITIKKKNIHLAATMIVELLSTDGRLPRIKQSKCSQGFYPAPGVRELLLLAARHLPFRR